MKKYVFFIFCLIMVTCAFSQEKNVKVNGVAYRIDLKNRKASVGANYKKTLSSSIKGTANGNVEILPYVTYNYENFPVESIDDNAFLSCNKISSLSLPATLRYFNQSTFEDLPLLSQITVDPENPYYKSFDGILYSKSMDTIIKYPPAKNDVFFQIPSTIRHIDFSAFNSCHIIKNLYLPDSLESIGEKAFFNCYFDHLRIPESTESIGARAFCQCYFLKSIIIPFNVKAVGNKAFENCNNLEKFIYQNDELDMPSDAIENCPKLVKNSIVFEVPISSFLSLAQQGVVKYQYKIGICFLRGYGFKQNLDSALVWLNKSAENGFMQSQVGLGRMYYNGNYVNKDLTKGVRWLTKAAEGGDSEAQYLLGNHYYSGIYAKKNVANALKFYLSAANNGYAKAEGTLASFYFLGDENVERDFNKAFKWYQKAADHGDTLSCYTLGVCYNEGLGTEKNDEYAFQWVEKAFKSGVEKAKPLYLSLAYGDAVKKLNNTEYNKAIERFSDLLTYDENNVDCLINRGYCYLNIQCKDYSKAKVDFEKALTIDGENTTAKNNLNIVNDYFQKVEEANRLCTAAYNSCRSGDYISAIASCSKSISLDNTKPYPYYLIGYCYSANSLYFDAIRFYDMAISVDPGFTDAINARKSAKTLAILTTISQALTAVSNSFNAAYAGSSNIGSAFQSSSQSNSTKSRTAGGIQQVACSYCHGTGDDPYPSSAANFGLGKTMTNERCSICGKYESHYHKKCPSCNGKGFTKKFVP